MRAMNDVLKAFLTKKGYVHRDISPGNIIIYDGRAKLNDLEFAKEYGTGTSNYIRTKWKVPDIYTILNPTQGHAEGFSHNSLRNLESIWWVGVWFLLYHYRPASNLLDGIVQRHLKLIKMAAQSLFNNGANLPNSRRQALISQDILTTSNPRTFPKTIQHLVVVHRFRAQLVKYYKNYEFHDRSFFTPDIHRQYGDLFERAMESLKNDDTELWPLDHIERHVSYLRKRSGK